MALNSPESGNRPSLIGELKTLYPKEIKEAFYAPPCSLIDMARDIPWVVMTYGGSIGWVEGVKRLHEFQGIPNPEIGRPWEMPVTIAAILILSKVAHYINRRMPLPFGH